MSQLLGSANLFKIWSSATSIEFYKNDDTDMSGAPGGTERQKWLDGTLSINYTTDEQEDENGDICGLVMRAESYDLTLTYVPSSTANIADAATDAYLPDIGGYIKITGAVTIKAGADANILNRSAGWLITGASLAAPNADRATMTLNCKAYPLITDFTAVAAS